jgi:catalase-peroxidase
VGDNVPEEKLLWQDPLPEVDYRTIGEGDVAELKAAILETDLTVPQLVRTAWASAASYRGSDMRGGTKGGRVALAPQNEWDVNDPEELSMVLATLEEVRDDFNGGFFNRKEVSLADLIVIGGAAAIEKAAADAGHEVTVPVTPGRVDATAEMTDVESFEPLEPKADGFRNYYSDEAYYPPVRAMIDRADLLTLTVPEMTVLVGGLRALDANAGGVDHGVFTETPGQLTPAFFVNLLDMSTEWSKAEDTEGLYVGRDRASGERKWTATPVDLLFGSHSELRAVAEVYASADGEEKFVADFVDAWTKVMMNGRFDV